MIAKDGKITREYFIKLPSGKLIEHGYPVIWIYTPVKDGPLLTMLIKFKMEGAKENGLEMNNQATWNGKIYASKKEFKMNWLLISNKDENNEWKATNVGQDHFVKKIK